MTPLTIQERDTARAQAERIAAHAARQVRRGDAVANVLLAVVIGVAGAAALLHWFACSQEAAMCMAAAAVPLRTTWWARLKRRIRLEWVLSNYRHAIKRVENAEAWIIEDQLELASAQADVIELRAMVKALDRQP